MSTTVEFNAEAREALMEEITRMLKTGTRAHLSSLAERLSDIEGSDLDKLLATALESATLKPSATAARANAVYLAALVRDYKYAMAGREYLFALGASMSFRSAYEGARVAVDAGNSV